MFTSCYFQLHESKKNLLEDNIILKLRIIEISKSCNSVTITKF